ncbi:acyl-CoA dehydrogenase [Microbacterium sp. P05]|uniref:acyl-CoA dehydrogenase n=1 Tax=Microbacterium sp. P05 TaxID=3366948 RepID=UPI0037453AE9
MDDSAIEDGGGARFALDAGEPATATLAGDRAAAESGFGTDLAATLAFAAREGHRLVALSKGDRWSALAAVAAVDVAGARVLEPHLDALSILDEYAADGGGETPSGVDADAGSTWGVFAAEGPGVSLQAREQNGTWRLSGTKPWCSLAAHLTHALVTAWTAPDRRRLFAVDLRAPGVHPHDGPWVSRGLSEIVSAPVDFDEVAASPVGGDGWYLRRPGFGWGGIGVAAVWWGAAAPLVDRIVAAASTDGADQLAAVYAGEADAAWWAARAVLRDAAQQSASTDPSVVAHRVRAIVAGASETILSVAGRALGPGPLTTDKPYARRVADLALYLRQHHGERDLARLGRKLATS